LFWERWRNCDKDHQYCDPVFTLYEDRPGLINARKTFIELEDPTGYQWAIKYLGDWSHWLKLMKAPWFREAYETWLDELSIKLKSEAIQKIRAIAEKEGDKQALPAARYLADETWNKSPRGRPSKAQLQGELKKEVERLSIEDEDAKRIGLRVVK
jgi:hypothetical protein